MRAARASPLVDQLRQAAVLAGGSDSLDGDLLGAVIDHRDEAAFEAIVNRHGPMVLGVCQRVLQNHHDAEDAFQATFLVLARKAASVKPRSMLGNWLHGVAYRTALEARTVRSKRLTRQSSLNAIPEVAEMPRRETGLELQRALDEELNRLPGHYRAVIVLCDLQGKTQQEAARQLACPPGTVACRLVRGRALLAKRLARHALSFSGGSLATALPANALLAAVPASLIASTVKAAISGAAASTVPVDVAALTERVLKNMLLTKLKTAAAAMLVTACVALGLFQVSRIGAQPDEPKLITSGKPLPKDPETAGKPLPQTELPVGKWTVEFANGVIEVCEIRKDGTATVVEPKRTSSGKATIKDNAIMIAFEDDRLERWRPVGKRVVVEHWHPGNQEPAVTPVLGVAVSTTWQPGDGLTAEDKGDFKSYAWPVLVKMDLAGSLQSEYTDEKAREIIDPGYIKEHNLTKGAFPMVRFVRDGSLYDNRLCDDYQTGIMIVDTNEGGVKAKELFVFRVGFERGGPVPDHPGWVRPNRAYILPPSPPDPVTKSFKPWIFRTKL
jgi:RNA polymerase sigma factor (sigma-70 family)